MPMFACMLKGKVFLSIVCMLSFSWITQCEVMAQETTTIQFELTDGATKISSLPYLISDGNHHSHALSAVRFYIHGIRGLHNGKVVLDSGSEHFLFDSAVSSTLNISLKTPLANALDEISFVIGVDSSLQMNGAQSGVLDPMLGMYWTWQSGYIHWKLETAQAEDSNVPKLTWHVGGYRAPFNTLRTCRFTELPDSTSYTFRLDVNRLISEALSEVPLSAMSPSTHAMELADIIQMCFQWHP